MVAATLGGDAMGRGMERAYTCDGTRWGKDAMGRGAIGRGAMGRARWDGMRWDGTRWDGRDGTDAMGLPVLVSPRRGLTIGLVASAELQPLPAGLGDEDGEGDENAKQGGAATFNLDAGDAISLVGSMRNLPQVATGWIVCWQRNNDNAGPAYHGVAGNNEVVRQVGSARPKTCRN